MAIAKLKDHFLQLKGIVPFLRLRVFRGIISFFARAKDFAIHALALQSLELRAGGAG